MGGTRLGELADVRVGSDAPGSDQRGGLSRRPAVAAAQRSERVNGAHIARNVGALAFGHVATNVVGFVSFAYIARVLGPGGFGLVNFASAILAYFSLAATMGIPTLASREIARNRSNAGQIAGDMMVTRFVLASIAFLALIAATPFIAPSQQMRVILLISGVGLFSGAASIEWAYAGVERLIVPAIAGVVGALLHLGLVFLLVRSVGDVTLAVVASLAGGIASACLQVFIFHRWYHLRVRFVWSQMREIIRASVPFAISAFMIQIYYNIDSVILGYMRGATEVGYYNAAYKIVLFVNGFTGLYVQTIYPVISRLYSSDPSMVRPFLRRALNFVTVVALPLGVGGTLVASRLITFIFGPQYLSSGVPFGILIWSVVIIAFSVHYGNTLLACNGERVYAHGVAWGAMSNLVLNLVLIPSFGAPAAAATTVLAEAVVMAYMVVAVAARIGYYGPDPRLALKAAANVTVMGLVVWALLGRINVLAVIGVGAVLYGALALVTGTLRVRDVLLLLGRS